MNRGELYGQCAGETLHVLLYGITFISQSDCWDYVM